MAINKKIIHFKKKEDFDNEVANGNILDRSIVFIQDTLEIYTHGTFYDGKLVDLSNIEASILNIIDNYATKIEIPLYIYTEITYSLLKTLVDNGELIPGKQYAITDYSCIYIQPVSLEEMEVTADDIEYIVCTAISNNELSKNVEIIRAQNYAKIIECRYEIDPQKVTWTKNMTTKSPKGAIIYMKDEFGNNCYYDFKHIKFRRWAITDIIPCTTPDDGNTYPCSPYKVYMTDTAKKWADDRLRIGSGGFDDASLIEGIFSGKWANATEECKVFFGSTEDNPVEFTDKHVLTNVKPYQDPEHPRNKYLAWQPAMNDTGAFSNSTSNYLIHHQAVITTDVNDFVDVYTFDYNGSEGSDVRMENGNPRIYSVTIERFGVNDFSIIPLPNTVFMITSSLLNVVSATSLIMRKVMIHNSSNNTILMHPLMAYSWALWVDNDIHDLQSNLLITLALVRCELFGTTKLNILIGMCTDFNVGLNLENCVMFGGYNTVELGSGKNLLWYGTYAFLLTNTSGSYTTKDGTYTYEVETEGNLYSNIMCPMQYCNIAAHFNTNTLRSPYTKGLSVLGANLGSSYGQCKWGVTICYGAGGYLRYGKLLNGTVINTYTFITLGSTTANGIIKVTDLQHPDMVSTHVRAHYGLGSYLQNLSEEDKKLLSSRVPTELTYTGGYADAYGKWVVKKRVDSIADSGTSITKSLNKVINTSLTNISNNSIGTNSSYSSNSAINTDLNQIISHRNSESGSGMDIIVKTSATALSTIKMNLNSSYIPTNVSLWYDSSGTLTKLQDIKVVCDNKVNTYNVNFERIRSKIWVIRFEVSDWVDVQAIELYSNRSDGLMSPDMVDKLNTIPTETIIQNWGFTKNEGTVKEVIAGSGLEGGSITESGTISLPSITTSGTYGPSEDVSGSNSATISVPQLSIDAYGRVTSAVNRTYTSVNTTYSKMSASEATTGTATTARTITAKVLNDKIVEKAVVNDGNILKVAKVSALPSSPDANTLYIIMS